MTFETIEWHQAGQRNVKLSLDRRKIRLKEEMEKLKKDEEAYNFKEMQICEALRQGKEKFDDEKFLVRKSQTEVQNR